MKFAVTGGTGFIGGHLANLLRGDHHEVVVISRSEDSVRVSNVPNQFPIGLDDEMKLVEAFSGCDAVAHCAGINREIGDRTYESVHIQGTRNVVAAAEKAGVKRIVYLGFLRARPDCGSPYHESKFKAEEIVGNSKLSYTILKPGVVYGKGDHMLDHLSHALYTFPFFLLVGFRDHPVRPLAVEDLANILKKTLLENPLPRKTIFVTGPEEMTLARAVGRVAGVVGKNPLYIRIPVGAHYVFALFFEAVMKVPLVAKAQVRILSESLAEPLPPCDPLPEDLRPRIVFSPDQIRKGLPPAKPFGLFDLRIWGKRGEQ